MQIGKSKMIKYYSSTLMYNNLYVDNEFDGTYGEGVMSVSLEEFQTYTVNISDDLKDSHGRSAYAWIVHERFNPLYFIKILGTEKEIELRPLSNTSTREKLMSNLCKVCFWRALQT